jgi:hypothetical protein
MFKKKSWLSEVAKNKRFEKLWLNHLTLYVIITIINENPKWFWLENGSYMNESPLPTYKPLTM